MLIDCNSNATGNDLADAVDDLIVKYGVNNTDREDGKTKLAFGESTSVSSPKKGMLFKA